MTQKLIGLRFGGAVPAETCSAYMKRTLAELAATHHKTFDLMLYPYADTLLLSEGDKRGSFFGTHAILRDIGAAELAAAVKAACGDMTARLMPTAVTLDCTREAIAAFLRSGCGENACGVYGDFCALLEPKPRPYTIRAAAKTLCSFCELAARMNGVHIFGLVGGRVCARVEPSAHEELSRMYAAKTGGSL